MIRYYPFLYIQFGANNFDRLTSFPILLAISFYERQSKLAGTITIYDTVVHIAEKVFDTLPRSLKRMSMSSILANSLF
jgi:hypothetical protein